MTAITERCYGHWSAFTELLSCRVDRRQTRCRRWDAAGHSEVGERLCRAIEVHQYGARSLDGRYVV